MRCRNPFLAVALSALVLSSGFCLLWAEPALSLTPGKARAEQETLLRRRALRLRRQRRGKALSWLTTHPGRKCTTRAFGALAN